MYLDFYNLTKNPFHITPDPEFFFSSPSHREAWAAIIYGVEERKGFIAITGEVGVGKTTVLRSYLEGKRQSELNTIYIFNANLSFRDLLKLILRELSITDIAPDIPDMVHRLHLALIEEYTRDRTVVLVIDEAQNMPIDTLENLRMLSNLETSKDKLLQIVMVGQPEFDRILGLRELRQLAQRIAIRSEIKPLTQAESAEYINHRLRKAGSYEDAVFSRSALRRIVKEAKGIPRVINILCDNALITGYGYQRKPVPDKTVKEVISDLKLHKQGRGRDHQPRPLLRWSIVTLLISAVAFITYMFTTPSAFLKQILGLKQIVRNPVQSVEDKKAETSSPKPDPSGQPGATLPVSGYVEAKEAVPPSPGKIHKIVATDMSPTAAQNAHKGAGHEIDMAAPTDMGPATETASATKPGPGPVPAAAVAPAVPTISTASTVPTVPTVPTVSAVTDNPAPEVRSSQFAEKPAVQLEEPAAPKEEARARRENDRRKKIVTKGTYLSKLIHETYGYVNDDLLQLVKEHNPQIKNVNFIQIGDEIVLPDLRGKQSADYTDVRR